MELAARIGQGLLARNKALEERLVTVEVELTTAHDTVTQLKHDLLLKSELLQIYTNDFDDSSPEGGESLVILRHAMRVFHPNHCISNDDFPDFSSGFYL